MAKMEHTHHFLAHFNVDPSTQATLTSKWSAGGLKIFINQ